MKPTRPATRASVCLMAAAATALLLAAPAAAAVAGQATWYPSIYQGSCGYFGNVPPFVAAWPDTQEQYATICGRCFAVSCRPTVVRNADGPWAKIELPRDSQCKPNVEVVVKITDTCPCKGNEQWCCNNNGAHLDLSDHAFGALVNGNDIGVGIIGISYREVSCDYVGVRAAGEAPSLPGGIGGDASIPTAPPQPQQPQPQQPQPQPQQPQPQQPQPQPAPQQPEANPEPEPKPQPEPTPEPAPQQAQPPQQTLPLPTPAPPTRLRPVAFGGAEASVSAADGAAGAGKELPLYAQCGGAGGSCPGPLLCKDAPFAGYACAGGKRCVRQNRWFWQCVDDGFNAATSGWATQAPKADTSGACRTFPGLNEQCGGAAGACDPAVNGECKDAPFAGACCLEGSCKRQNAWYWQCE